MTQSRVSLHVGVYFKLSLFPLMWMSYLLIYTGCVVYVVMWLICNMQQSSCQSWSFFLASTTCLYLRCTVNIMTWWEEHWAWSMRSQSKVWTSCFSTFICKVEADLSSIPTELLDDCRNALESWFLKISSAFSIFNLTNIHRIPVMY